MHIPAVYILRSPLFQLSTASLNFYKNHKLFSLLVNVILIAFYTLPILLTLSVLATYRFGTFPITK